MAVVPTLMNDAFWHKMLEQELEKELAAIELEDRVKALAKRMAASGGPPDHVWRGTEDGRVEHIWIGADGEVHSEMFPPEEEFP